MDISGDKLAKSHTKKPAHGYTRETSREKPLLIAAQK